MTAASSQREKRPPQNIPAAAFFGSLIGCARGLRTPTHNLDTCNVRTLDARARDLVGAAGISRFRAPALPSGMVDVRFFVRQQELGDRHDLIALAEQVVENIRQCLRRVLARVVEEHDGAVCHLPRHALGDLTGGDALPVERITIPYSSKPLPRKGLASIATFVQLSRVDLNSDITHVGKRKAKENKVNKRRRCAVSKTGTIRFVGRGISSLSDVYID